MTDESSSPKLPLLAEKLLTLLPEDVREEIEGDLVQRHARDLRRWGRKRADLRVTWHTIGFLRPSILFRRNHKRNPSPIMLRNYFVIAFRNVLANKTNSSINILSLVIGITSALMMASVVRYELGFDRFHSDADRIYRVHRLVKTETGFTEQSGLPGPAVAAFRDKVTAVSNIAAVQYYGPMQIDIEQNGETRMFKEPNGAALVDSEFFEILDFRDANFRWISGDPSTAFKEPFSVVLTESIARKYFGTSQLVGKTIRLEGQLDCNISGVVSDLPPNSDFPFTILVSYPTLYEIEGERMRDDWMSINSDNQAFVLLPEGTSKEAVEAQLDEVHASHVDKNVASERKFRLQPLSELHRNANLGNFNHRTIDEAALWIIALTGLLLLMVGCINYINITTAQSTLRLREIGVRKVLGGLRLQLIAQFLSETFVLVTLACLVSLLLAQVLLQNIRMLTNIQTDHNLLTDPAILASMAVLIGIITVLAGLYPAAVVSGQRITHALKGVVASSAGSVNFRRTLVIVQFAITQAFLIGSFIVINQLRYSRTMDLGFDKDLIVTVPIEAEKTEKMGTIRALLQNNPDVASVAFSSSFPSGYSRNHWFVDVQRKGSTTGGELGTEYQAIDTAYMGLYHLQLVAGRNFFASDSGRYSIINQSLAAALGFSSADEAVGNSLMQSGREYTIVGVVKDFHESSSKEKIGNMLFELKPNFFMYANVRLKPGTESLQEAVLRLEKTWATVYPSMVFDYKFFDQNIERLYQEEKKLSLLLQLFSIVFLLVSCLGLYGLLSFVVNRRMKEVAVRKVFGASVSQIVGLISKDYVVLVLVSFVIAAPLSYYVMDNWLSSYQYHIPITWWILAVPGIVALGIALLTLSGKLVKAALRNPSETLKHE